MWKHLPTHKHDTQTIKQCLIKRLGKDVCNLLFGINMINGNGAISNMFAKVMVLDRNMFRAGCKFGTFRYLDAAHVVLENTTMKFWLRIEKLKDVADFLHKIHEG